MARNRVCERCGSPGDVCEGCGLCKTCEAELREKEKVRADVGYD